MPVQRKNSPAPTRLTGTNKLTNRTVWRSTLSYTEFKRHDDTIRLSKRDRIASRLVYALSSTKIQTTLHAQSDNPSAVLPMKPLAILHTELSVWLEIQTLINETFKNAVSGAALAS